MSFVVTGGTGFVGLNLVEAGLARGDDAVIVSDTDLPAAAERAFAGLPGRLHLARADAGDAAALARIFAEFRPDTMFPFAAVTPDREREALAPEAVLQVNVMALLAQIRAARDAGIAHIVVPASGGVYGASTFIHPVLSEDATPCLPESLYATSKYAAETASLRLGQLWDLDVKVARIGGVFGPWERDTGARQTFGPYYRMLLRARAGEQIVLSDPMPSADAIYVRDLVAALWHLAALTDPAHRVFNVSTTRNWRDDLPRWADRLVSIFPRAAWRASPNPSEINIRTMDDRDRGLLDVTRLAGTGWREAFAGDAAHEDFEQWIRRNAMA